MRTIGRFAPSPTGPLHFGSLVAAVASWLDARAAGGEWHLRIEDVDTTRTVPGAEATILHQLEAFGLHWDGPVIRQSERSERYREALASLGTAGFTFACRCSRKEIADSAMEGIDGVVYPGTCRSMRLPTEGASSIRFRVSGERIVVHDRAQGEVSQDLSRDVGDFVIRRRDGLFAYQLAVVVDDAELGVTDVVRGADLLDSTPRQIALQHALGFRTPRYLHVPVATRNGEKLSKQSLAPPADPSAASALVADALAFLGQAFAPHQPAGQQLAQAIRQWDPARIPRLRFQECPPAEGTPR